MNAKEVMQSLLDGKKLRFKTWPPKEFICCDGNNIIYSNGNVASVDLSLNGWEIYSPPKQKKRFWIWAMESYEDKIFHMNSFYIDDCGRFSNGDFYLNWEKQIKIKVENHFIDIEWEG